MQFGICNLSIVPLRIESSDRSEMVSQLIYGDLFEIIESKKNWSKIRLHFDSYEGWVDNKQFVPISEADFLKLKNEPTSYSADLIDYVSAETGLIPVPIGASLNCINFLNHQYEGNTLSGTKNKSNLVETAFLYLNAPYLWGGKTPFGIDCSGFTQMVYKLNGYSLLRDASLQATQGDALSFIEESEPGDLAFFDNEESVITHVGIIMKDNYIIHAHGKVRID